MITTTLGALVASAEALGRLRDRAFPVRTAYHVNKLTGLVRHELEWFHAQREGAIKERGAERAPTEAEAAAGMAGPVWQVKPEALEGFRARMLELEALPVELPWAALKLEALDGHPITAADLGALVSAHLVEEP